jgi:hypothetical protein
LSASTRSLAYGSSDGRREGEITQVERCHHSRRSVAELLVAPLVQPILVLERT